jgi:IclR family KDG regulon transcriptional repressor
VRVPFSGTVCHIAARGKVQSLDRALRILEGFGERQLGVSEIAREQGLTKSTAFRLVSTLRRAGYLQQDAETGRYALGLRLLDLGQKVARGLDVRRVARPAMFALAERTRASVFLAVLFQGRAVNVEQVDSSEPVRVAFNGPDFGLLPHTIATGKVLLAALPSAERDRAVAALDLPALTPYTLTSHDEVLRELERIDRQGYAVNDQEQVLGVRGVAAPVRDHRGEVIAAISAAAPAVRLTRELLPTYAVWVRAAADEISRNLGAPRTLDVVANP